MPAYAYPGYHTLCVYYLLIRRHVSYASEKKEKLFPVSAMFLWLNPI